MQDLTINTRKQAEIWWRIEAFLDAKSANTQRTYKGIVEEWCNFLGAEAASDKAADLIIKAKDLHALAYRKWLTNKLGQKPRFESSESSKTTKLPSTNKNPQSRDGTQSTLANATIAKKIAALRRIYRMLIASSLGITQNPFDSDKVPAPSASSGQKRPTEMLPLELVKKVFELPDLTTEKGLRDMAILALLFGAGLRRSEVVKIKLGDLKRTERGTMYIRLRATKAKRDADQALPGWTAKIVLELQKHREASGAQTGDYLIISYRGPAGKFATPNPLTDSGLYKLFKSYCTLAGGGKYFTPHSARATAITRLLDQGFTHREVKEFSRHASVQMVEVYDKRRISVDESPAKDLAYD